MKSSSDKCAYVVSTTWLLGECPTTCERPRPAGRLEWEEAAERVPVAATTSRGFAGFALIDHAGDVSNLLSVVVGKLAIYRSMAEATTDVVCDHLGLDRPCAAAERERLGASDPERLDAFEAAFGGPEPSDRDVVACDCRVRRRSRTPMAERAERRSRRDGGFERSLRSFEARRVRWTFYPWSVNYR